MADTTGLPTAPESSARERALDRGAVAEWFARAHHVPPQALAEWSNRGLALLPLGVCFDAIRVPGQLLHTALGSDDPQTVAAALDDWLHGPVIHDTRTASGCSYVLIAPDAEWEGPSATERLQAGTYLSVPRIGRQTSPVTFWAVPPQRYGQLCDPAHLAALLSTAEPLKAVES
ncbi:hypothetical protein [Streptomyces aureocirculatus]|uniref:hypothetical protein n=1 Tax=Streptomyces aureocirculatus TaxID=67275 RepID=UPI00068E3CD6|nr:hypothetical protein [Streptomyces aureocirculatus]